MEAEIAKTKTLYKIIEATIGKEANKNEFGYQGSPIAKAAFLAEVSIKALRNGKPKIAHYSACKIMEMIAFGEIFDATGTIVEFCYAVKSEVLATPTH